MNQSTNRSNLFLTELIIGLCIFVVCAAVCVGLLVHAYGLSNTSETLTDAVYIAQTVAERTRMGEAASTFYRADGTIADEGDADFMVVVTTIQPSGDQLLESSTVEVFDTHKSHDQPCYTLTVKSIGEVSP